MESCISSLISSSKNYLWSFSIVIGVFTSVYFSGKLGELTFTAGLELGLGIVWGRSALGSAVLFFFMTLGFSAGITSIVWFISLFSTFLFTDLLIRRLSKRVFVGSYSYDILPYWLWACCLLSSFSLVLRDTLTVCFSLSFSWEGLFYSFSFSSLVMKREGVGAFCIASLSFFSRKVNCSFLSMCFCSAFTISFSTVSIWAVIYSNCLSRWWYFCCLRLFTLSSFFFRAYKL